MSIKLPLEKFLAPPLGLRGGREGLLLAGTAMCFENPGELVTVTSPRPPLGLSGGDNPDD